MKLYNTMSRTVEDFTPLNPPKVTLYTCGPTVYDFTHLGHMRKYTADDVLKRTLNYLGFNVKHVMNITDVGHLVSDADAGEDKLEKGAKKTGKTVWEVAQFYTDYFMNTMHAIDVIDANVICKATDHIQDMIKLNQTLVDKGFAYETDEALYFDVTKFPNYGKLSGQKLSEKEIGVRDEVIVDPKKKHPADFVLWFKRVGRFKDHTMHWDSPWGDGFPGWHIECSAMSMKYLGDTLDIHTGGIDHIPVHHENEIAQSEAATGKQFVKYWVHNGFLQVEGEKMSKSLGNFFTIDDVKKKGIVPLALRYLFLQTHYRQQMNFTWEALQGAAEALKKLQNYAIVLKQQTQRTALSDEKLQQVDEYRKKFIDAISNDLQLPQAVATMWEMLKSNIPSEDKYDLLMEFDQVLGLNLATVQQKLIPAEITALAQKRLELKQARNFAEADKLRNEIDSKGYIVEDTKDRFTIKRK